MLEESAFIREWPPPQKTVSAKPTPEEILKCPSAAHIGVNGERGIPLSTDLLIQQRVCQTLFYTVSDLLISKLHVSPTDS
jgi:hypothetical protein